MNQVIVIGQMDNKMDNKMDNTFESANRVYDTEGVCPTIPTCAGGNIQPKIITEDFEPIIYDNYNHKIKSGVCGTLGTGCGGTTQCGSFAVIEYIPCAMRGRNPDDPSDRTKGAPTVQRLEPHEGDFVNTLTSVSKDNLVIEKYDTN